YKALLQRRFSEREYGVVVLDARDVQGDGPAGGPLLALVIARQIGADALPTAPLIRALQYELRCRVQNIRIVRRDENRFRPLNAVLEIRRPIAGDVEWIDRHIAKVLDAVIVACHLTAIGVCVDNLRIARVRRDIAAFPAPDGIPVLTADDSVIVAARNGNGRVVLLRTVHTIWPVVVDGDVIELCRR